MCVYKGTVSLHMLPFKMALEPAAEIGGKLLESKSETHGASRSTRSPLEGGVI